MGYMLYFIAFVLIIGWFVGFYFFKASGIVHTLLVMGVAVFLLRLFLFRKSEK